MRTLPLVPFVKERLLELKAEQEENRRLCGRSYVKDYTGYVCINEIGDIIKPNYVSCGFPKLLEEHGLRRVRYHDLRHSCASLLLANGVPMKQIQEWLGHSDFSTTANIYAHLEYSSKVISADAMLAGLGRHTTFRESHLRPLGQPSKLYLHPIRFGKWGELMGRTQRFFRFRTLENLHKSRLFRVERSTKRFRFRVSPVMTTSIRLRIYTNHFA